MAFSLFGGKREVLQDEKAVGFPRNSLKALFLGNALSLLVSCVCLSVFGTEKWGGTFEPAAALQMLCAAALLALAVQLVWWRVKRRTQKRS